MAALNAGTTEAMQRQHASDADCFALPARSFTTSSLQLACTWNGTVMPLSVFVKYLSYLY